jgi:hypothetical protein
VQKHAMALGYFFLAVFCIFVSSVSVAFRDPLQLAALIAVVAGLGFQFSAVAEFLRAAPKRLAQAPKRLAQLIRAAQEPPSHQTDLSDEHPA